MPTIDPRSIAVIRFAVTNEELHRLLRYANSYGSGGFQNFIRSLLDKATITIDMGRIENNDPLLQFDLDFGDR